MTVPGYYSRPERMQLPAVVGIAEVAQRLQVERSTVDQWRRRGVMPAPDWPLEGGPVWLWETVRRWAEATGRYVEDPG